MQDSELQPKSDKQLWTKPGPANLIRYSRTGIYFARLKVKGKLIRRSLKTDKISVAKMRLGDMEKVERQRAETRNPSAIGRLTFGDALTMYRARSFRPVKARNRKDSQKLKPRSLAYYGDRIKALLSSWPGLERIDLRRITEHDCLIWAKKFAARSSAGAFNHTLGVLRNVIDYGVKAGARYDNPAMSVARESEKSKTLRLPEAEQFDRFVKEIENSGSGFSKPCADLVRFLAYGGFRIGEVEHIHWQDCQFERDRIIVRGDPETGTKGEGDARIVPMIPEMKQLLERLRADRANESPHCPVMTVNECQKSMTRSAQIVGMERITHHDLRHLFATRCIESGVDIPTVSRWLGHRDGGALAMRTYGHLRDDHSAVMAKKVSFSKPAATNIVPLKQESAA